ncbi:MAG TPA: ThuA domain-containing protein [Clostridia bacterium]|nr:ThuA domain-containing protein [Clostridia bacterium]
MKTMRFGMALGFALSFLVSLSLLAADTSGKTRVLVVTGGHDFETEPFFKVFKDNPEISYRAVEHPNAHALLKADAAKDYDVLVLYDMHQDISEAAKKDFVARLKDGKGLVVLHHAIASYQKWPEYAKIIGVRYYLEKTVVNGVEKPQSTYKHDMNFTIRVADPKHPITKGVKDFAIRDETYGLFDVFSDCHPLLTTEEPESNKVIGWVKSYENARVVYLQSGHDHFAYENPNFRQLLRQAIRWAAKKDSAAPAS